MQDGSNSKSSLVTIGDLSRTLERSMSEVPPEGGNISAAATGQLLFCMEPPSSFCTAINLLPLLSKGSRTGIAQHVEEEKK